SGSSATGPRRRARQADQPAMARAPAMAPPMTQAARARMGGASETGVARAAPGASATARNATRVDKGVRAHGPGRAAMDAPGEWADPAGGGQDRGETPVTGGQPALWRRTGRPSSLLPLHFPMSDECLAADLSMTIRRIPNPLACPV